MKNKAFLIGFLLLFLLAACSQEQPQSDVDQLKSLPYLTWMPIEEGSGSKADVTIYDENLSFLGVNIYNSRNKAVAYLIDMEGNRLHNWSAESDKWQFEELTEEGDLFVIVKNEMLMKLNWGSELMWAVKMRFHHDIAVGDNGDVYSIARDAISVPYKSQSIPLLNDYIVVLSPDGKFKENISIFELFKDRLPESNLEGILTFIEKNPNSVKKISYDSPFDVFHTNSIEIIENDIPGLARKGDLLISIRQLNIIAIIDHSTKQLIWTWGENDLRKQHHPSLLDNGNILIFDNQGADGRRSRIVELNPITEKIEWEYNSDKFFSRTRGGNQRLPNGNTLVTESDTGNVFEITPDGQVVWEFWNPEMKGDKRAAIYRMMRLDPEVLSKLPFDAATSTYLKDKGYVVQ